MRYSLGLICVFSLAAAPMVGCSGTADPEGGAGEGGEGGSGGDGGANTVTVSAVVSGFDPEQV